jgi:hypothetical protein
MENAIERAKEIADEIVKNYKPAEQKQMIDIIENAVSAELQKLIDENKQVLKSLKKR